MCWDKTQIYVLINRNDTTAGTFVPSIHPIHLVLRAVRKARAQSCHIIAIGLYISILTGEWEGTTVSHARPELASQGCRVTAEAPFVVCLTWNPKSRCPSGRTPWSSWRSSCLLHFPVCSPPAPQERIWGRTKGCPVRAHLQQAVRWLGQ